ncbi:hypothetical protein SD80_002060 [Scytonema tolypothrichoides VB-61278]|nr:hypothetical protein SD80_002060 [Scytonema tolypothrichoides VB-61278]
MQKQAKLNQLSERQKQTLLVALWVSEKSSIDKEETVFVRSMKQLLLRAFVIHKRYEQLSPDTLYKYHCDFQRRLKQCLELHPTNKREWGLRRYCPKIPYYLFLFLEETKSSTPVDHKQTLEMKNNAQITDTIALQNIQTVFLYYYYIAWINLVRRVIEISAKNSNIVSFKKALGCISLIPIKIGNEHLILRGFCINYHDLYHLEVSQLERIKIGKSWVSGIHGINSPVFHNSPIVEEYDGYLDEARIAIHEGLTRPSAFSLLKGLCWIILLILKGIDPLAVLIRHIKSMEKKQQELWYQ